MMSLVMHRRGPTVLARALDLGIAMQFSNICRDVGEDARNGRLYLPEDWLRSAGVDPDDFLVAPRLTTALGTVIHDLLAAAEAHYVLAGAGIAELPPRSRIGINAARLLYREIGRLVAAGVDPVSDRAVVTGACKLALLAKATRLPVPDAALLSRPCASEAAYLVDAVARGAMAKPARQRRWWDVPGRAVRSACSRS
jgi:phytoene synthase